MSSRLARLCAAIMLCIAASQANADFIAGVNFNGNAVTINGNLWQSEAAALSNGLSFTTAGFFDVFTYGATPTPAVDVETAQMLNDVRYLSFGTGSVTIHQTVPSGQAYSVQLWTIEGYQSFGREMSISGDVTTSNFGSLEVGGWEARSLATGVINDGSIDFTISTLTNQPVLSGMAIYSVAAVPEAGAGMMAAIVTGIGVFVRRRRRAGPA